MMQSVLRRARLQRRGMCSTRRHMEHLKKDILFTAAAMMNDAAAGHSGQGALFVEDLLSSSCELAVEQFAPLREDCRNFSPSYDPSRHRVSHVEGAVPAMKKYAELGLCGLSMDYEFGGSQLPLHTALLARLPFVVANEKLAAPCFISSSGFSALYNRCFHDAYGAEQDFPGAEKDSMMTTIANGINYGAVCLSGRVPASGVAKGEGWQVEALLHSTDKTTHFLTGRIDDLPCGILHEFGDNTFYIVPAHLPHTSRPSLFLVPRFVELDASLERKFRDGMTFDKGMKCNNISFENVSNNQTDIVFGNGRSQGAREDIRLGSIAYLIADEDTTSHAIRYYNQVNNLFLSVESIGKSVAEFLHSMEILDAQKVNYHSRSKSDNRLVLQRLLRQKVYSEGAVALSVYVSSLMDRSCGESTALDMANFEFMSLLLRCWTVHYCDKSTGISKLDNHNGSDVSIDTEWVALSVEFLKRINDGGYENLIADISATVDIASSDKHQDILGGYAADVKAALSQHADATKRYVSLIRDSSVDGSEPSVINSHEFVLCTGHLCMAWVWLRQGVEAHRALLKADEFSGSNSAGETYKNFYLGKISALDYFCNYELVKIYSQTQLLVKNPQILDFAETEWLWQFQDQEVV